MAFWVFIAALIVAGLAFLCWVDGRMAKWAPAPDRLNPHDRLDTEEALLGLLDSMGFRVTDADIAGFSDDDFDASWNYARAIAGGSAQSTTDPPIPACLRGRRAGGF